MNYSFILQRGVRLLYSAYNLNINQLLITLYGNFWINYLAVFAGNVVDDEWVNEYLAVITTTIYHIHKPTHTTRCGSGNYTESVSLILIFFSLHDRRASVTNWMQLRFYSPALFLHLSPPVFREAVTNISLLHRVASKILLTTWIYKTAI